MKLPNFCSFTVLFFKCLYFLSTMQSIWYKHEERIQLCFFLDEIYTHWCLFLDHLFCSIDSLAYSWPSLPGFYFKHHSFATWFNWTRHHHSYPSLFFSLGYSGSLVFHMNFRSTLSISAKKPATILIETAWLCKLICGVVPF